MWNFFSVTSKLGITESSFREGHRNIWLRELWKSHLKLYKVVSDGKGGLRPVSHCKINKKQKQMQNTLCPNTIIACIKIMECWVF